MSSNFLTYKTYSAAIEFDAHDNIFFGRVIGIRSIISFHAETVARLKKEFHIAIDDYLADCAETGEPPEKPASGNFAFRMPPERHIAAICAAKTQGKSLNQWLNDLVETAV